MPKTKPDLNPKMASLEDMAAAYSKQHVAQGRIPRVGCGGTTLPGLLPYMCQHLFSPDWTALVV